MAFNDDVVLPGYRINASLHRGTRSNVFRATRLGSDEQVVLKVNAADSSFSAALIRAQHELEVSAPIRSQHIVTCLGIEQCQAGVVVIREAFGDCSLAHLLSSTPPSVEIALRVGAQIALGLAEIHAHDVVHLAIHPGNIVVDARSLQAKIIDFSEASTLGENLSSAQPATDYTIPLPYISPEQTRRLGRHLDYRTDFYSLGATLYHILAGRPPFEVSDSTDPLATIHAHIALAHRPLSDLDARVPKQVSRIVDKLLAKTPDDRYQSGRGIAADLEECLKGYRAAGVVEEFELGRHDAPRKFRIPKKLYGRSRERAELLEMFQAVSEGRKFLALVAGDSGVGKSSLVNEFQEAVRQRRGTFVSGKFDQLLRQAPYSALGQALSRLCRGLLSVSEDELTLWKTRILEQVSVNAGLIVDLAPELERILGPQSPVPATGLVESQHRFEVTLAKFLSTFASEKHPLVLFLG